MKTVVCTKCNRTYFAITQTKALEEVESMNRYLASLDIDTMLLYYGTIELQKISAYTGCRVCSNNEFKPGNTALEGSTLSPVIYEEPDESS